MAYKSDNHKKYYRGPGILLVLLDEGIDSETSRKVVIYKNLINQIIYTMPSSVFYGTASFTEITFHELATLISKR
jgi:hypothetical protein